MTACRVNAKMVVKNVNQRGLVDLVADEPLAVIIYCSRVAEKKKKHHFQM